ncbi:MAG: YibE/F family protein [Nocardioidaceae bacterium]|nr:YibE/F family protein [Nocardioidaceae bacterium]
MTVLLGFLVVCAVATVIGVVALWPDSGKVDALREKAQFAAPGVTFPKAEVLAVRGDKVTARLTEGPEKGTEAEVGVPPAVARSGLAKGDTVRLMRVPGDTGGGSPYSFVDVVRSTPLWILWVVFVLVVALVARLRGILALVALGFGGLVLVEFMLPALLSGSSGLAVALVGSAAIMFVVLYLAHGPSVRTSAALAGTLLGVGITAAVGQLAIHGATLSGFADEDAALLSAFAGTLSFQGLLTCALVVAGLGVLNDVTITQASAVWELREAGPELTRRQLFTSGMRIGRDHIASTIYTIVFAYAGSALAVLLLLTLYDRPLGQLLSSETIAEEIVRTLASGIGLVLAVPVTTLIAAFTVAGPRGGRQPVRRERGEREEDLEPI